VIILSAFFISLWGGSIRFNVPMLFTIAFLPNVWHWRSYRHPAGI
jgi:heme/copper-type cytochrome/quinol oxidase subunit 1